MNPLIEQDKARSRLQSARAQTRRAPPGESETFRRAESPQGVSSDMSRFHRGQPPIIRAVVQPVRAEAARIPYRREPYREYAPMDVSMELSINNVKAMTSPPPERLEETSSIEINGQCYVLI